MHPDTSNLHHIKHNHPNIGTYVGIKQLLWIKANYYWVAVKPAPKNETQLKVCYPKKSQSKYQLEWKS